jgi:hypothetical protein
MTAVIAIALALLSTALATPAGASATAVGGATGAQSSTPRLVSGGGGFADAPLLVPGIYTDTLLPRETLFYAVSLAAGQRLRARATIDVSVGSRSVQDIPDAVAGFSSMSVFTPLRQRLPIENADAGADADLESVSVAADGPRVLSVAAANRRAAENEDWTGPGVYQLAIVLSELTRDLGATVELPLRLAIEIDGPPQSGRGAARASPGPLGDPRVGPRYVAAAAPRAGGGTRSDGEQLGPALLAAGVAGGLAAGAALGFGIAAGRRRS